MGDETTAEGLAILVPMKAPPKLKNAAISRAIRGVSARVETEVTMALAAEQLAHQPLVRLVRLVLGHM